jgi:hypothetical protein
LLASILPPYLASVPNDRDQTGVPDGASKANKLPSRLVTNTLFSVREMHGIAVTGLPVSKDHEITPVRAFRLCTKPSEEPTNT